MKTHTSFRVYLRIMVVLMGLCLRSEAMDRWTALSLIESGDDDRAIGTRGEISRYQIRPAVWRRYAPANADWGNPEDSLTVAKVTMEYRCMAFERAFHRPPTDFEFYVLWNAPAQIQHPSKVVSKRAERFSNLIALD